MRFARPLSGGKYFLRRRLDFPVCVGTGEGSPWFAERPNRPCRESGFLSLGGTKRIELFAPCLASSRVSLFSPRFCVLSVLDVGTTVCEGTNAIKKREAARRMDDWKVDDAVGVLTAPFLTLQYPMSMNCLFCTRRLRKKKPVKKKAH